MLKRLKKLEINLGSLEIKRFSDGEIFVEIDESVIVEYPYHEKKLHLEVSNIIID